MESSADTYIEQLVARKLVIDRVFGNSVKKIESVTYYLFRLEFEVSNISPW